MARRILEEKRDVVEAMTAALLEWETIDAEQVKALMEGRKPNPPANWVKPGSNGGDGKGPGTGTAVPAQQPPVTGDPDPAPQP